MSIPMVQCWECDRWVPKGMWHGDPSRLCLWHDDPMWVCKDCAEYHYDSYHAEAWERFRRHYSMIKELESYGRKSS